MDLTVLQKVIGVKFRTKGLLVQALTHSSYYNENKHSTHGSNELLEFLGDAVLELVVTEFIMVRFSDKNEGGLTAIRAKLVCNETLGIIGEKFNLHRYIRFGRSICQNYTLKVPKYHTACVYEALVGAIYADIGYKAAQRFIHHTLLVYTNKLCLEVRDPKTILNQMSQKKLDITPTYKELGENPTSLNNRFIIGVFFDATLIAQASGRNKKQASMNTAKKALRIKGWAS